MVGDSLIHYINFRALAGALGSFERLRITSSSQKAWSIPSLNIHVSIFSFLSSEKPKNKSYIMIKPKLAKAVEANLESPRKDTKNLPAAHLAPQIISTLLRHCLSWNQVWHVSTHNVLKVGILFAKVQFRFEKIREKESKEHPFECIVLISKFSSYLQNKTTQKVNIASYCRVLVIF